jgi:hypothetical protein
MSVKAVSRTLMKLTTGIMSVEQFLKMERDGQIYANDNNVEKWVRKEKHLSKTKKTQKTVLSYI